MKRWLVLVVLAGALCSLAATVSAQPCPTVVVIIPEEVIIQRVPRQVPDPAAETAIIHAFLDYGMHVVDQRQVRAIRYSEAVEAAASGDQSAILQLSERFSADILVLGEAVSVVEEAPGAPGQPRIQSGRARVEVRAIESRTGRIIAAEALHTGGIDLVSAELAGKRSLQQAGAKIACPLAQAISRSLPRGCVGRCEPPGSVIGVMAFRNESGARLHDLPDVLATMVGTALSKQGYATAHAMAGDYIVTGSITEYKELLSPAFNIPGLNWLWRTGTCWMTVDVQVFDLETAEMKAYEVAVNATGIEILGIRFGFSSRNLARKASQLIAVRIGALCGRR